MRCRPEAFPLTSPKLESKPNGGLLFEHIIIEFLALQYTHDVVHGFRASRKQRNVHAANHHPSPSQDSRLVLLFAHGNGITKWLVEKTSVRDISLHRVWRKCSLHYTRNGQKAFGRDPFFSSPLINKKNGPTVCRATLPPGRLYA